MDKHTNQLIKVQIATCRQNLEKHGFNVSVCLDEDEVKTIVDSYLKEGSIVSVGGSMTLNELNLLEHLKANATIKYLDRYGVENPMELFREAFKANVYLMSSNAVTLDGELVNVDGNGNRVAALTFGPDNVLVIVGQNKLVKDLEAADERLRFVACPANNVRLGKENPCTKVGYCVNCQEKTRICDSYVITKRSHFKQRIHVIIVEKDLGY